MLTSDVRQLFQRAATGLGGREAEAYPRRALATYEGLRFPGGELEVVGELNCARHSLLELAAWRDEAVTRAFGLDGGSSRTMVFRNGTVACANQGLLACERGLDVGDVPLEAYRTLAWVTHSREERLVSGAGCEDHGWVRFWRLRLGQREIDSDKPQRIQEVVKAMADVASEPQHLLRMAELVPLGEGDLVFVDGRFYPLGLYAHLLNDLGRDWDIDLTNRDDWIALLQAPLDFIHLAAERGLVAAAINKTPTSRPLLRFGVPEPKQLWHNDRQFVSALFERIPGDELGYTNWFVWARHPSPTGRGGESIDLFEELVHFERKRPARDYHIAFFFVYDPRVRSALRVEVPRVVLERHGPERLRLLIMSHIACGNGGVPNAIRIADAGARITQEEREALLWDCGLTPDWEYNQSRGAPR